MGPTAAVDVAIGPERWQPWGRARVETLAGGVADRSKKQVASRTKVGTFWRDPCFPTERGKGVRMKKHERRSHERRSPFQAYCALGIALGCAVFAPLGCGDDEDTTTGSTGGSGGAGGTGGSAGSGTGGTAGTGDTDAGGEHCGGFASLRCSEPELAFCDYDDKQACGQTDATGICFPRPVTCTDDCPGVCGCNGMFYCNACEANRAGTDIYPTGTCVDGGHSRR